MIRPRAGDFVYSDAEFAEMRASIEDFGGLADGFVFGILTREGRVDGERCSELVNAAGGKSCTFHRAVDEPSDLDLAEMVEEVVRCGFASVLTSGRGSDAVGGVERLEELRKRFEGRIEIVVGGGVRRGNVGMLRKRVGEGWFHSAAVTGEGEEADEEEARALVEALGDVRKTE
jgi:copper homeostasis protein